MCLFYIIFIFVGPRAALAFWWLVDQSRFNVVYNNFFLPFLGFIFLPLTTIMWTLVWQVGGVNGWSWIWVGLGLVADIAAYGPGGYSSNRNKLLMMLRSRGGTSTGTTV